MSQSNIARKIINADICIAIILLLSVLLKVHSRIIIAEICIAI